MDDKAIVAAIVGLVAALIGGLIQASSNRRFEEAKFGRQARNDAYAAYLKGISQLSFAEAVEKEKEALALIAEARGRVALFGSAQVVEAMTRAFKGGMIFTQVKRGAIMPK